MPQRDKVPATIGQVGEIAGALIGEMNFTKDEAKVIIGKMGAFRRNVRRFYLQYRNTGATEPSLNLLRWETVYGKLFGLKQRPDLSEIHIPEKPEGVGPTRLIVVAHEIIEWSDNHGSLQGVQETLKEHFPCWQYADNLDKAISVNDRDPRNGSYAVWVKDVREADEEYSNKSADDLKAGNHTGITLLERQLMEADYFFEKFFEKSGHLDQENVTLCSGSRDRNGLVPCTGWRSDEFFVYWYDATDRYSYLRSRRVWV